MFVKVIYAIILEFVVFIGFAMNKCLEKLEPEYRHKYYSYIFVWVVNYPLRRLCQLSEEINK